MGAYHQMGHDSENLLLADGLHGFVGAIVSPLNYEHEEVADQVALMSSRTFECVFDPQLYYPRTERGVLRSWDYFPDDLATVDLGDEAWWARLSNQVADTCVELKVHSVCSPVVIPRVFDDAFFGASVEIAGGLVSALSGTSVEVLQTVVVSLAELAAGDRVQRIASIVSRTPSRRVYVVFVGDTEPRREIRDLEALRGGMDLVAALRAAGMRVLVGFTSTDSVLWKSAGADDVATGKFFNLRRFARSRFEEPSQGGGQLPYWFEEGYLAFFREADLRWLVSTNRLSSESRSNPFGEAILGQLASEPGRAWQALSWRQYMYWFASCEKRLSEGSVTAEALIRSAENAWHALPETFIPEEMRNDGGWLPVWRQAVTGRA